MTAARETQENFKLINSLGVGGFAQTWLVEVLPENLKKNWGERVAIKIPLSKEKEKALINELITNATLHQNLREMQAKNIVEYLGFEMYDNKYVMVMEYIEGESLRTMLGPVFRQKAMQVQDAMDISVQICEGLAVAHDAHIFHRDMKPENILVSGDGTVKIADFGIARMLQASEVASTNTGTLFYMAKEALEGSGSFYSDIYSMGVTMYEMLTGKLPFVELTSSGDVNIKKTIDKIYYEDPVPPAQINKDVDEELNAIILKAIDKNNSGRYPTARALLDELRIYAGCGKFDKERRDIGVRVEAGLELLRFGRFEKAEEKFKEIVTEYPDNPKSYLALGEFYNRCQRCKEAVSVFKRGLRLEADSALLYRDMAFSLHKIGSLKQAIAALKKAIELGLETNLKRQAKSVLTAWEKTDG